MPPLTTQQIDVRLGKADTKTSDKLTVAGSLTVAQNVEVINTGRYQRRPGTLLLDSVTGATRLHSGERELLVGTPDALYSDLDGVFDNRGAITAVRSRHTPINNSSFEQLSHDFLRFDGLDWHVWSEAGSGIFYAVRDSATGAYLVIDGVVSSNTAATSPKIIQGGPTTVFITYVDAPATTISCRKIDTSDPTLVSAETKIENGTWNAFVQGSYDVVYVSGTKVCFAYMMFGITVFNQQLRLREWNTSTQTSIGTSDGTSVVNAAQAFVYLQTFIKVDSVNGYTLAFVRKPTSVGATALGFIRQITAAIGPGAQTSVTIYTTASINTGEDFYNATGEIDANGDTQILVSMTSTAASPREQLWRVKRTAGGVNSGPFVRFGFRLMGKLFSFGGQDLVMCASGVTLSTGAEDRSYFLIEILTGAIVGRALPSLATDSTAVRGLLPTITVVAATTSTDAFVLAPTQFFVSSTQEGAALVRFEEPLPARWLEVASVTLVPGSTISIYDGAGLSELGFYHPPSLVLTQTGVGFVNGIYAYRGTWAWTDAQGRFYESDASEALSITTTAAQHPVITTKTLNATLKSAPVQQAVLRLWRTTVNPSSSSSAAFFLVTTVDNVPANDTIVVNDSLSDAVLATHERLYTLGNTVLGNTTPPPANALAAWNGRVWAAERDLVWFSKEIIDGFGVFFSDQQFIQVSDDKGDVTAIADAGPRFAIFKGGAIYTISGDGPDSTGKGSFSPLRRLPVPLGARSAVAVISTELGVFFQDDASGEIWILPPDGDPVFVGKEVSDLAPDLTIKDMVVVPSKRQVRIFSEEGTTLVYDLTNQLWTWYTEQDATAAAVVDDVCGYITTDGRILFDDPDTYEEGAIVGGDGTPYTAILETSWIAANGIGGYQRVFAVTATGEKLGDHTIACKLSYRYNGGEEDEGDVDVTTIDDSDFGFRIEGRPRIRNQKATAIKIRYEDDAPLTAGFALEALNLTVGIRPTRERLTRAATTIPPDPT